ncbi:MAG TPA: bifunctional phosphopantothenoylcysteine decarboxylase/phosphopantothenate--cysteine ligase CoaBC [Bryobacteraceae bacterium]|nr:bifunctional phosphopantothenoylcysteine decarboxylase/phosphopantothenate--cysteine ligase CoaBC [Bryobacteraceae bacterium]
MNVALGVGGGIAAYKAAELARALMERGLSVEVVMTSAAEQFVRPLTFAALTGRKVLTNLFSAASAEDTLASAIEHIRLAQENRALVIAPATADLLAKLAHGLADDLLTTMYLAFTGQVVLAPAMNVNMWNHAATRENLRILRERGHMVIEPEEGVLACGMVGPGRLAEPQQIADAVLNAISGADRARDLGGETILITAGPTQEPLDAVRYITNRSSGKMGYALAEEARARGARVVLISGPVDLAEPGGVEVEKVRTASEMRQAVMKHLEESTMIIKAAAVADYHRANPPKQKEKKTAARLSLELDPTPDILAELGKKKGDRILVGFAAETENLVGEAKRKLESKNCDMIVANLVSQSGIGFDADENEVTIVTRAGGALAVPRAAKRAIARRIFDEMLKLRLALHAAQ